MHRKGRTGAGSEAAEPARTVEVQGKGCRSTPEEEEEEEEEVVGVVVFLATPFLRSWMVLVVGPAELQDLVLNWEMMEVGVVLLHSSKNLVPKLLVLHQICLLPLIFPGWVPFFSQHYV